MCYQNKSSQTVISLFYMHFDSYVIYDISAERLVHQQEINS